MLALLSLTACFPDVEVPPPRDCEERIAVFEDTDGDGFGNPSVVALVCEPISGFVDNALDCDDTDALKGEDCSEDTGGGAQDSGDSSDSANAPGDSG